MTEIKLHIDTKPKDLMSDVLAIRDGLWAKSNDKDEFVSEVVSGDLSQEFALQDPDLAMLFKDMQNAASQLSQAKKDNNMTGIMKWRYESAESAYQTRLLEVRRNKFNRVPKEELSEDAIEKRQLHELSMQQKMNDQFASLREKRLKEKKRKESSGTANWFFFFILGLWLAQMNNKRLEHDRLRNTFSNRAGALY